MRGLITAAFMCGSLAGCNAQQQNDALNCGAALMLSGGRTAVELVFIAQQVPACRALALETMQQVVAGVVSRLAP